MGGQPLPSTENSKVRMETNLVEKEKNVPQGCEKPIPHLEHLGSREIRAGA